MARNIVGTVVRGEDFYGRESFVQQIWGKLETTNILLAAPRRFGKTSVMYNLYDFPKSGFKVIPFDLEPVTEPVDFVVTLLDKLRQDQTIMNVLRKGGKTLRGIFQNVEIGVGAGEDIEFKILLKERIKKNWREVGAGVLKTLEGSEEKLLLIFDEFAIMIENFLDDRLDAKEVREFFHWFRQVRISPSMTNCRFLIGSSISIDHHLSKLGIAAALNDFEKMVLAEFEDSGVASSFVDILFDGVDINISKNSKQKILELIGPPIPYFIHVLVSEIIKKFSGQPKKVASNEIEKIYSEFVLGVSCKSYFQHYYDRLRYYDIVNQRAAKVLLKDLSIADEITKTNLYQKYLKETQQQSDIDNFNNLMSDLENDFYIKYQSSNESYVFFSKILRDWWRRYYSL